MSLVGTEEFTTAISAGLSTEETGRNAHLPILPWKEFECLRLQLLTSWHMGAENHLSLGETDRFWDTLYHCEPIRTEGSMNNKKI